MASLNPWNPIEARRQIAAPPEAVWAVFSDPCTYPDWLMGAQKIRAVDPGFPTPGTAFHHSVGPVDDATAEDSTEVLASDPPRLLVLKVHVGPLQGTVEMLVLPDSTGTEVRFREVLTGPGRLLTPLVRPVLHGRNLESLRRLDDLLTLHAADPSS